MLFVPEINMKLFAESCEQTPDNCVIFHKRVDVPQLLLIIELSVRFTVSGVQLSELVAVKEGVGVACTHIVRTIESYPQVLRERTTNLMVYVPVAVNSTLTSSLPHEEGILTNGGLLPKFPDKTL